jgi:hypothetical protein
MVTIAEQRGFQDSARGGREISVNLGQQALPPFVNPGERQEHALVVKALDQERAFDLPGRIQIAPLEIFG